MKSKRAKNEPMVSEVRPSWWQHAGIVLALMLVNLGLYYRAFHLDFLPLDDPDYILNNPYIAALTWQNLRHILTQPYFANFSPLHILSYVLDVALAGGKSALAMHLSNVLWHGCVIGMVYWLAFSLRADLLTAGAAALLFAVHPAHVEVVAWVSSRKDLVATSFAVLAMVCYVRYRRPPNPSGGWYAASVIFFLLASAGKQSVALLPGVMLAYDLFVDKRRHWMLVLDKIPFGLITLVFALLTYRAQPETRRALGPFLLAHTGFWDLWLLTGLGDYVLFRATPDPNSWSESARFSVMVAAVVVWILPFLFRRQMQPLHLFLCYWILIQLVPPMVMNFIRPVTDRYLFLPSVGICLLVASSVVGLAAKYAKGRWMLLALLPLFAGVWTVKTWNYLSEWLDPRSVWSGAVSKSDAYEVFQSLGETYADASDRLNQFLKSGTSLNITNETKLARLMLNDPARIENLLAEWQGKSPAKTNTQAYRDELQRLAWENYEQALARRGTLSTPNLFMRRGKLLVDQGKFEQAIAEFKPGLQLARMHSFQQIREENVTHFARGIGIAYWNLQNYKEAKLWFLEAQRVQRASSRIWISTLDQEVERIKTLAGDSP